MAAPPTLEQQDAIDTKLGDLSVVFLIIIGLWLLLAPLVGDYTGYGWLEDRFGGPGGVALFFVGFLFLYFAGIVREKNDLRVTVRRLRRLLTGSGPGKEEQVRMAVELLLPGLDSDKEDVRESAHENLVRLTGQDLGADKKKWDAWWEANRDSFRRADDSRPPAS